jgi:predicted nucleic acid-binding protein
MTFADLATGDAVFVDANTFTYHFQPDPRCGPTCTQLLDQIENRQVIGYTDTHVIGEVSHRLMTLEAHTSLGWPMAGIGNRLRTNPSEVRKLVRFRTAVEKLVQGNVRILTVTPALLVAGAALSQQLGLLTNDGLIVAVMHANGLSKIASSDSDFDGVPGLTRYAPP